MKYKFVPNEFEIDETIVLKKIEEEIIILIKAIGYRHIFKIENNKKRWVMNPETFNKRKYNWNSVQDKPLEEVKKLAVSESINDFGPVENPPEFYYPDEPEPNPYMWIKGLWVLGSGCPDSKTFADLGFNCVLRVGGGSKVEHIGIDRVGSIIYQAPPINGNEKARNVKLYFTRDEPEIVGKSPQSVIDSTNRIHQDSNLPAGVVLTTDFHSITKNDWNKRWKKVVAVCDWVGVGGCYWYRENGLSIEWRDKFINAVKLIQAEGKPVIGVGQAHISKEFGATKPDMFEIDETMRNLSCPVIWYAWRSGEESIGQTKWYDEQIRKVNKGR